MANKVTLTSRQLRERKFLLRAPLIAVPALTLLFWLMGGGRGDAAMHGKVSVKGFNTKLPGARLGQWSKLEKLDFYNQAEKDSIAARQRRNSEANYARMLGLTPDSGMLANANPRVVGVTGRMAEVNARPMDRNARRVDDNVLAVQEKLAEVKRVLAAPPVVARPSANAAATVRQQPGMDRLERLMGVLRAKESSVGADPEMAQLNSLLDKLAGVQRPGKDSGRGVVAAAVLRAVLTVRALPDAEDTLSGSDSTIEALVSDRQVLVSGGQLRLELLRDIVVGGKRIPRGTPLSGSVALSGERLRVVVMAIAVEGRVYPVNLMAADEDGLAGIYIPGAPMSDAVRESAEQEVGGFGPTLLSTSLAGEAAGAGVSLARSMLARKMRPVKVTVPAGYRVILVVQNQGL